MLLLFFISLFIAFLKQIFQLYFRNLIFVNCIIYLNAYRLVEPRKLFLVKLSPIIIEIKQSAEGRISELILQQSRLYQKPDAKGEIADINIELKELRAKVRMCNNILIDSERINEKYNEAQRLEQEAMVPQKHKKKDKDKEITR